LLNADVDRLLGSSAQFARVNDNGSIGIFDILQSSLGESTVFQLLKWITIRNSTEFIETSSWTPTAGLDSVSQRDIECCTIDTCLSARNDFHLTSVQLVAGRNNVRTLDHQDHGPFRRARAMAHAFGHNETLPRRKIDNAIFKIDQEMSVENEKKFIDVFMFVPVIFALDNRQPDD